MRIADEAGRRQQGRLHTNPKPEERRGEEDRHAHEEYVAAIVACGERNGGERGDDSDGGQRFTDNALFAPAPRRRLEEYNVAPGDQGGPQAIRSVGRAQTAEEDGEAECTEHECGERPVEACLPRLSLGDIHRQKGTVAACTPRHTLGGPAA